MKKILVRLHPCSTMLDRTFSLRMTTRKYEIDGGKAKVLVRFTKTVRSAMDSGDPKDFSRFTNHSRAQLRSDSLSPSAQRVDRARHGSGAGVVRVLYEYVYHARRGEPWPRLIRV